MFGIGHPDDLHFGLICSDSKVDLFMAWIIGHFQTGDPNQLLKSNLLVEVCIEKVEDGSAFVPSNLFFGLHELEVPEEVIQRGPAICVVVVGGLPEALETAVANLRTDKTAEDEEVNKNVPIKSH